MTRTQLETKDALSRDEAKGGMPSKIEKDEKGENDLLKVGAAKNEFEGTGKNQLESPIDRDALLYHADLLEQSARVLRHYIEQVERPDLRRGALGNESDKRDSD